MINIAGEFTQSLWLDVKPIYKTMIKHKFVKGLQQGNLHKKAFKHYLAQDSLYLKYDIKAINILVNKLEDKKTKKFFKKISVDILAFEEYLNKKLLKKFKIKKAKKSSKVIKSYGQFLVKTSKEKSITNSMAALLPCFWIYTLVGLKIYKKSKKNNIYQDWIEFYNDKQFLEYTNSFITLIEDYAKTLSKKEHKKMRRYFIKSSKLELAFFDEAIKVSKRKN